MTARMRRRLSKRGSAYMLVLGSTVLITAMIFGALELERAQSSTAVLSLDASDARLAAQSGLEVGIDMLASAGTAWRSDGTLRSGTWMSTTAIGRAKVTVTAVDPVDGNISSGDGDPIVLTAVATVGSAKQAVSCTLTPVYVPSVLATDYSLATLTNSTIAGTVLAPLPVISWGRVSASAAAIGPKVYANTTSGSTYQGGTAANTLAASTIPSGSFVDTEYTPLATQIAYSALPGGAIDKCVMGPGLNPFDATNAKGIYQINCGGSDITIRNCRILGTLILNNPGKNSKIEKNVLFEQYIDGMPVLLTRTGGLAITIDSNTLKESDIVTNLNPVSVPYEGASNATTTDSYPTGFGGLVFIDGDCTLSGIVHVSGGFIVNGKVDQSGALSVDPDVNARNSPPPGFRTGPTMVIQGGSIVQVIP